ncbi:MAG: hypothetical protein HYX41_01945 [Bdellovibrio sp.]|nr:hypothetical protein [Bdellovibrio sp.]
MSAAVPWILLIIAGLFEVCWAIGLKYSEGFTKVVPTVFTAVTLLLSMLFLSKASQSIPIGTAYSVWVGIGALGAALFAVLFMGEPSSLLRWFFLFLLLISVIGLKVTSK